MPDVACLVGNGASIAYNSQLSISNLTAALAGKLAAATTSAEDVQDAWERAVVAVAAEDSVAQFERLLGPLERMPALLDGLSAVEPLVSVSGNVSAAQSLSASADFLRAFYKHGVGFVLEAIDDACHSRNQTGKAMLDDFVREVLDFAGASSKVTFGTLNYDSLLNGSVLSEARGISCDLADARVPISLSTASGPIPYSAFRLRESLDLLPARRVRVFDLHGSVYWWAYDENPTAVLKIPTNVVRDYSVLESWRKGDLQWRPVVLLTDQKAKAVRDFPFSMAYEGFASALAEADTWLIVGYGFGDAPVNEMLASAVSEAKRVVVVDFRVDDRDIYRAKALQCLQGAECRFWFEGLEALLEAGQSRWWSALSIFTVN